MPVHDKEDVDSPVAADDAPARPFRFKGESDRHHDTRSSRKRHRHHHPSRHRSKRSRTSHLGDDPSQFDPSIRNLGRDRAFQESLFDAMGDDEGAAFWEGVYGQPIHNYPNTYFDEETGELGQMDDEEYAQYVRRKMWEKSREGVEAAREEQRRAKAREQKTAKEQKQKSEEKESSPTGANGFNFVFDMEIDASLRRGQRRKDYKRWQELWKDYLQRWDELQALAKDSVHDENLFLRNKIAWPVESGKRKDVTAEEIEKFITKGAEAVEKEEYNQTPLLAALKLERIRWHPDKIQQRYGLMQIDDSTMKGVTATFQTFDRMWNDLREPKQR